MEYSFDMVMKVGCPGPVPESICDSLRNGSCSRMNQYLKIESYGRALDCWDFVEDNCDDCAFIHYRLSLLFESTAGYSDALYHARKAFNLLNDKGNDSELSTCVKQKIADMENRCRDNQN